MGLYVRLEREGRSNAELRLAAYLEEATIDVFTAEGACSDDDLETLAAYLRERVDGLKTGTTWDKDGRVVDRAPELAETEKNLATVLKWQRPMPQRREDEPAPPRELSRGRARSRKVLEDLNGPRRWGGPFAWLS